MGKFQWIGIACVFTLIGGISPALAAPSLSVSTTSAQPGATVTVTVSGGPQPSGNWVGIFRAGEADQQGLVDWQYLSGTKAAPPQGLTGAELHFVMPSTAGHYDFRFFWDNSWSSKLATSSTVTVESQLSGQRLPADASNPFIWDNDSEYDAFPLAFAMALAHNGTIRLIGISQSPNPYKRSSEDYQAIVQYARQSGWQNIPDAAWDLGAYYMTALSRPGTGNAYPSEIDSTVPFDTASARMIRDQVLAVGTASKPVVIGTGGALTTVASAYVLALRAGRGPEFAQKAIVYAGMGGISDLTVGDYNALQDEWATYVVMQRLHVVLMQYEWAAEPTFMWEYIDTLAAAYAESGDFERAVYYENDALSVNGISEVDREYLKRQKSFFEHREAYHEASQN